MDGPTSLVDETAGTVDGGSGALEEPVGPVGRRVEAFSRLCYDGESVVEVVPFSGGAVGVTTHRVLALTPDGGGPNLQAVERPNVTGVEMAAGGDEAQGIRAVRYGVYALALVGGSYLVDFGGVASVDPPSGTGAGQVVNMAMAMTGVLALVDDVLRLAGLGVLAVALLFAAAYGRSRDSYLAIGVAGGDPLCVPASRSESTAATRLRVALEKASNPSAG